MNDITRTSKESHCASCGMLCNANEYHPYAACLMFMACHDGNIVRANLTTPATSLCSRTALDQFLAHYWPQLELRDRATDEPETAQPDSVCKEDDGCPTELVVLKRFWREHRDTSPPCELPSTDLVRDVFEFLQFEQQADVAAVKELNDMTRGKIKFGEDDQAMKTFRRRADLILKLSDGLGLTKSEQ